MGKRLFVGNIPYQTDDAQLRSLFEQDGGQVEEVKIVTDRETGRPRGFAFVEMQDGDARKAIGALHEREVDGRRLNVNEARAREDRGGGGGGGGGSRGGW